MALFIDRLPLHLYTNRTSTPPAQHWSIRVLVFPTPEATSPAPNALPQQWVIDTGFTGEALCWRHHLEDAGLDADRDRRQPTRLRLPSDEFQEIPVRMADLWLISNVSSLEPIYVPVNRGIAFWDQIVKPPDPVLHRALIGMRLLVRLGFRLETNFSDRTFSIWSESP